MRESVNPEKEGPMRHEPVMGGGLDTHQWATKMELHGLIARKPDLEIKKWAKMKRLFLWVL